MAAPRIHHQWLPDQIVTERGLSPDTIRLLEALREISAEWLHGRDGGEKWSCLFDSLPPIFNVKVSVV